MSIARRIALTAAALCAGLHSVNPVGAQSYPSQTIKIIVPASPGGANDMVARIAADALSKLGQPAIVEHRAGAGGAIGAREVAKARPDGHTLLVGNTSTLAVIPAVYVNCGYDPIKSFAPVAKFWESYQLLVVHSSSPWRSLKELLDYAKVSPGKLNYAHTGKGSLPHMSGEFFMLRSGAKLTGVSYRSGGEVATALLSQAVHMTLADITNQLPLVRGGMLRALAVTSTTRTPLAPDLPTMMEAGIADFEVTTFFGIVAPAGTPDSIVRTLNAAINEQLRMPETQEMVARLGPELSPGSPEDFAGFIAAKGQQWMTVAKAASVRIN